jgi:hypothetical protein
MKRGFKTPLTALPADVKERLEAEGLLGTMLLDFDYPPAPRCRPVQRSHPLVSILAETLLERTLGANGHDLAVDPGVLGRIGCWVAGGVHSLTWVALIRLRHQLITQRGARHNTMLVEEATAIAWRGAGNPLEGAEALSLLQPAPLSDPPPHVRDRFVAQALQQLAEKAPDLNAYAERRAQALLADHRRVREASDARGSYTVKALHPVDVIGLFVLLPQVT